MSNVGHSPFFSIFACSYVDHSFSRTDFKNPNDPQDTSFNPHPINYPVGELEFPNSGASERCVFFFLLLYVHGVWQCSPSHFPVEEPHTPPCSTCVVPSTTLKHDQTCIRSKRLMSRVRPSPPHFCPGPSVGLLATLSMQCTTLTRRAFHCLLCLGSCPCPSLLLRVVRALFATLFTSLSGPRYRVHSCLVTVLCSCTLTASAPQSSVHLVFPSLENTHLHHCSVPLILCLGLIVGRVT